MAKHRDVSGQGADDNSAGTRQLSLVTERRVTVLEEVFQTKEVFIELQGLIKTHRANGSSTIYADHEGLSIPGRLEIVQVLVGMVAYYELMKRCHLVELYK